MRVMKKGTMRPKKILAFVSAVAIGIAMFAAVGMFAPQQAEASNKVVVTISGDVTETAVTGGFTLHVQAQVSGPAASLTGQGSDSPAGKGYCRFPLTGELVGDVVTLAGVTDFTNSDTIPVGVPVTFVANASTGDITWTFDVGAVITGGPLLVFTGTGSVVIAQ